MKTTFCLGLGLLLGLMPSLASARSAASVRAQGMAGSYTAVAEGIDAPLWNPANLALHDSPNFSFEVLSTGAWVGNNGLDLGLYNRYSGATLDENDKDIILDAIPDTGLTASAQAGASVFGFSWRNLALSFTGHAAGRSTLPHDVFELMLRGNAVVTDVEFDSAEGEALAYAAANFSTAVPAGETPWGEVYLGANLRYLQGLAYADVQEVISATATTETGIQAGAAAELRMAGMGRGMGIDLGATAEIGDVWRAGVTLENAFARIHFDEDVERRVYLASTDELNVTTFEEVEDMDEIVTSEELAGPDTPFTVTLPRVLRLGTARVGKRTSLALDYTQGFTDHALASTTPRVAVGGEWRALSWLPLRLGLAAGGTAGRTASAGLGLGGGGVSLDLAAATVGEFLPGDPRGILVAAGLGLRF